jgi:hypothetical protein
MCVAPGLPQWQAAAAEAYCRMSRHAECTIQLGAAVPISAPRGGCDNSSTTLLTPVETLLH